MRWLGRGYQPARRTWYDFRDHVGGVIEKLHEQLIGRSIIQHRYNCSPSHCQGCELAARCVSNPSSGRTIKRMEGQELLDAQRQKMNNERVKERYQVRGETVERGFADAKGNRGFARYHGRGLRRARAETGLLVLAQNLQILARLERDDVKHTQSKT